MSDTARVRVFPSLMTRLIGKGTKVHDKPADTPGRAWLLLKELSKDLGIDGSVYEDTARHLLTNKDSQYRIAGKRHWRSLIARGEGVFWTASNGRLWLHGTARVCKALGVDRLEGRAVELPLAKLLGPIHKVRAVFYATDCGGRVEPKPMSRRVIEKRLDVSRRRQKRYERIARIKVKKHTAVMGDFSPHLLQRARYHYGRAAYNSNRQVCFSLPNSYHAPKWLVQLGRSKSKSVKYALMRGYNPGCGNGAKLADKLYHDTQETAVHSGIENGSPLTYWQVSKHKWKCFFISERADQ